MSLVPTRFLATAAALASLALATPAQAAVVQLTPEEAEALKLRLIEAKPNVSTVTIASFVFPGSSQAYMGHVDRTLIMWGGYLLAYTAAKIAIPDSAVTGGTKISDLAVVGVFMGMSAFSAFDAYSLALQRRRDVDYALNRLTERSIGLPASSLLPVQPVAPPQPVQPGF